MSKQDKKNEKKCIYKKELKTIKKTKRVQTAADVLILPVQEFNFNVKT